MKDPSTIISMTLCCLLIIFTVIEAISIEVLLMRGMPSGIRGTMMGIVNFFGQLGMLLYTLIGGWLFDRIDQSEPGLWVTVCGMLNTKSKFT